MTATPIEHKYILEELKHLPICEVQWPSLIEVKVRSCQTNKPDDFVAAKCAQVVKGKFQQNLHIFINSVDFIAKVIDSLKNIVPEITKDDIKVVCSTSGDSKHINQQKLGVEYAISQPSDPIKKINFYTSTCFEGCDIFDENGVTLIVSDGRKAHTLLDISTLFIQICGRIRNSKYKTQIIHVYSTTKYSKFVSLEEFEKATQKSFSEAIKISNDINSIAESSREMILNKIPYINEKYMRIEDNRLIADKNLANIDIVNYKITHHIYGSYVKLNNELKNFGYKINQQPYTKIEDILSKNPNARMTFQELFNEYHRLKTTQPVFVLDNYSERRTQIERRNPLVKQAYEELGVDKVRELKYNVGNIRRELTKKLSVGVESKIIKMLNETLQKQKPIPKSKIKECLQNIYDDLGIKQTAKATDIAK